MKAFKSTAGKSILAILIFTILCGIIYPVVVFGISQVGFKEKANGSIIEVDGKKYGSVLLAQSFTDNKYLWGRVMVLNTETFTDQDGNPMLYAGPSNKSPASEEYKKVIEERVAKLKEAHPEKKNVSIPVDLVTGSGSGLDPHISPAAAEYQVERIAKTRGISVDEVKKVIDECSDGRFLGVFGEPVVNVLKVNLMLDGILKTK